MTYEFEREIRFSMSIRERGRIVDNDEAEPSPSLPPQPVVDVHGETLFEQVRPLPLRKCGPVAGERRKAGTR